MKIENHEFSLFQYNLLIALKCDSRKLIMKNLSKSSCPCCTATVHDQAYYSAKINNKENNLNTKCVYTPLHAELFTKLIKLRLEESSNAKCRTELSQLFKDPKFRPILEQHEIATVNYFSIYSDECAKNKLCALREHLSELGIPEQSQVNLAEQLDEGGSGERELVEIGVKPEEEEKDNTILNQSLNEMVTQLIQIKPKNQFVNPPLSLFDYEKQHISEDKNLVDNRHELQKYCTEFIKNSPADDRKLRRLKFTEAKLHTIVIGDKLKISYLPKPELLKESIQHEAGSYKHYNMLSSTPATREIGSLHYAKPMRMVTLNFQDKYADFLRSHADMSEPAKLWEQSFANLIKFRDEVRENPEFYQTCPNFCPPIAVFLPNLQKKSEQLSNLDSSQPNLSGKVFVVDGGVVATKYYAHNKFEIKQAQPLLEQLAKWYIERGMVHRDIKPDNLSVRDGELCLIDFDFALSTKKDFTGKHITSFGRYAPECDEFGYELAFDAATAPGGDPAGLITLDQHEMLNSLRKLAQLHNPSATLKDIIAPDYLAAAELLLKDPQEFHSQYWSNVKQPLFLRDMLKIGSA